MNFIDLCAGIGGFRLGMEMAGHKCVGYCEIDRFARTSYKAMYDTSGEWERWDLTEVSNEEIRKMGRERNVQLICGGFPCQSWSCAGKRRGFDDARGTIIWHFCRFLREIRPRYFVFENVKGLLSHDGGCSFRLIVGTLAKLGYGVEWQILNSKDFGVPQNRERVYIVGHIGGACRRKVFPLASAGGENPCKLREATSGVKDAYRIYEQDGLARALKSEGGGLGAKTGLYAAQELITIRKRKGKGSSGALGVKRIGDKEAATVAERYYKGLSADGCNGVICVQKTHGKKTTVKENETGTLQAARLDKVPAIITEEARDAGVVIIQRGRGNNKGGEKDIAPTVTSNSYEENNLLKNGIRIRRLTPRECWRLQGFPDSYFDRAKAAGLSDTQLYKQAGNAVTVPVVRAIGEKLAEIYGGDTDVRR